MSDNSSGESSGDYPAQSGSMSSQKRDYTLLIIG